MYGIHATDVTDINECPALLFPSGKCLIQLFTVLAQKMDGINTESHNRLLYSQRDFRMRLGTCVDANARTRRIINPLGRLDLETCDLNTNTPCMIQQPQ